LTSTGVVEAIKRGFDRGEADFGVKARSIVCCIRGLHQYADDVLRIASECGHLGVVGVDVAGCAHGADEQYEPEVVHMFQEAYKRGIHRTVHAGESGGAKEVVKAITDMHAERIGHGYRVMREPYLYKKYFLDDHRIHLEACPYSSIMTGAVELNWKKHPIATSVSSECGHLGVVGVDVAGCAHGADEQYEPEVVHMFQEAYKRGIHRTVHAGESGGAKEVVKAITDMHAERIGHGYRVMREPYLYKKYFLDDHRIHLEACPYSSIMTGAVELNWKKHPIATVCDIAGISHTLLNNE
ncbi:Adenosine/AMP deaminase, partial [Oesophagostomum dentatum]